MSILARLPLKQAAGLAAFTGLFLLFEGYAFGVGNQLVFLPVIESLRHYPALRGDFGVSTHLFYHPFFNWGMAVLLNVTGLAAAFFCIQMLLLAGLHVATRALTNGVGLSGRTYWTGILIMFLWGQQGLDGNVFWVNRLEAQYLAWPCLLFAVVAFLRKEWFKTGLYTGLSAVFHIQMSAAMGIVFSISALYLREEAPLFYRLRRLILGGMIAGLPVLFFFRGILFQQQLLIGPDFTRYAALRAAHHMAWDSRLYLIFVFATFIPAILASKSPGDGSLRRLAIFQIALLVIGTLQYADYYLGLGVLSRIQFLRLMPLVYVTAVFFTARLLITWMEKPQFVFSLLACFTLFVLGPRFLAYESLREHWTYIPLTILSALMFFGLSRFCPQRKWPLLLLLFLVVRLAQPATLWIWDASLKTNDPWINACQAAGRIVPPDALVLSPPHRTGFAFFSKRRTLIEFKSGANLRIENAEWQRRLTLAAGGKKLGDCSGMNCLSVLENRFNALDTPAIEKIKQIYGAGWLLTESYLTYPYPLIFENEKFKLYQLPI